MGAAHTGQGVNGIPSAQGPCSLLQWLPRDAGGARIRCRCRCGAGAFNTLARRSSAEYGGTGVVTGVCWFAVVCVSAIGPVRPPSAVFLSMFFDPGVPAAHPPANLAPRTLPSTPISGERSLRRVAAVAWGALFTSRHGLFDLFRSQPCPGRALINAIMNCLGPSSRRDRARTAVKRPNPFGGESWLV